MTLSYRGSMCSNSSIASRSCVGLFPCFAPNSLGGIELSGRLAWEAIQTASEAPNKLFLYGASCDVMVTQPNQMVATSKLSAVWQALHTEWKADMVLIWHVGMLKLLPFFRLPHAQILLFLHGIEIWRQQDWFTQRLLRQVDCFLSNSQHTWQRFLEFQPDMSRKTHQVVHLGTGIELNTEAISPGEPPIALMVGRMARGEDYKGHREMIDAWPLVLNRLPAAKLWIAGDGDLRPDLEQIVKKRGLESHIHFWGRVSEEKKEELLKQCRCFAMPSRGEGFGLVYLEAMRLGRPCLVSTLDAGREAINPPEAGLAVTPQEPIALSNTLIRLLTLGPEWEIWSRQAQQRYQQQFTTAHFQQRLLASLGIERR